MTALPKWLKEKAAIQRQIRLNQPHVSSEEARRHVARVMHEKVSPSPGYVPSALR